MSPSCSLSTLLTIRPNLVWAINVLAESVNIVQQTSSSLQQRNRSTGQFRHKLKTHLLTTHEAAGYTISEAYACMFVCLQ